MQDKIPFWDFRQNPETIGSLFCDIGMVWSGCLSWAKWHSVGWTIWHALIGWIYVIYYWIIY